MIRIETETGWILIEHIEHARLAGCFAAHWGNADFAPPEPRGDILAAVDRHDDAWASRDADPVLTSQGRPGAFSTELVGRYSAFEEIDLEDYLAVRGRASDMVAAENPYAALIISMHTVDLLTKRADLTGLSEADRELHRSFISAQLLRQSELAASIGRRPGYAVSVMPGLLLRAFEFLQACDSLSLSVCVRYPSPIALRHTHPRRDGSLTAIECIPLGGDAYRVSPYPFDNDELVLGLAGRSLNGKTFATHEAFRRAYGDAPACRLNLRIVR